MERVAIVGASVAGLKAAEGLRRGGYTGSLEIIGAEPDPPYDRTLLSKDFIGGELDESRLPLRQHKDLDATWHLGTRATALDIVSRRIELDSRPALPFDGLVIATGATPRELPGVPTTVRGVHTLRTLRDATALRDEFTPGARIVIIGAGFIGTELASTCRALGLDTTIVTPLPLLGTALGALSEAMSERVRRYGVRLLDTASVVGIQASDRVHAVVLSDGSTLPADVVVVAVGAVPATAWLEGSGIKIDGGVVCDETTAVIGVENVVAAGDVARWPHPALGGGSLRLEHWTNSAEHGLSAGRRLATGAGPAFAPVPSFWSDQFDLKLQGVGIPPLADNLVLIDGRLDTDSFVVEYRKGDQLVGAVVAGQAKPLLAYRKDLARLERYPGRGA
jgi:3-phenylpropionate/trans-cinnamate dioxygenase ferredoxin reductase subunit